MFLFFGNQKFGFVLGFKFLETTVLVDVE